MANQKMLEDARQCLLARGHDGHLLVQSNVEDVAVTLREMAEGNGWEAVTDGSFGPEQQELQASQWQPRRQQHFAATDGRRAFGPGWLVSSPLPRLARTETEAYYTGESLPIHRVALRPKKSLSRSAAAWAAALNISPHDILPEELTTLQAYQVALITVEEERLVKLRQNRVADMKTRKMSMLVEDDYTEVARVRQDLQLTKELNQLNPHWPEAVDMTYLSPEECASLLIRQVKEGKKAAALRLPRTKSTGCILIEGAFKKAADSRMIPGSGRSALECVGGSQVRPRHGPLLVNELDHWGASALHHSARQGHEAVLKLLVHHQADISAMTSRMQTPADLARKHGHPSLAAILEQEVLQHAEVSKKQKKGACWTWFTSFGAVAVVLFASRFIHCNSETVF
ncbi:unnamed protein product [Cladocopium goreaui]|uniref:Uncharacterized protein n=1 Tax=Cladocopium goreaui TaxID=2562237 RepID=A0A9P1FIZ4_9DINO|nr:unnamed protein product [Cladocopium goreaui]